MRKIERKNTALILLLWSCGGAIGIALYLSLEISPETITSMGLFPEIFIGGYILSVGLFIYPLVMMSRMAQEINIMCRGDDKHLMPYILALLLGIVTMGIYFLYYLYLMQRRLYDRAPGYGVKITTTGKELVLWIVLLSIFFLGAGVIVGAGIIITSFNKMADKYAMKSAAAEKERPPAATPEGARTGTLRCLSGELRGSSIIMTDGDEIVIGRDPEVSDLVVNDSKVSRRQCKISYNGKADVFYITDFSSNGTMLGDGDKLVKETAVAVNEGTIITLSKNTQFTVN